MSQPIASHDRTSPTSGHALLGFEAVTARERLLVATYELFTDIGWAQLTMAKVADRAGLSRQTVYNEFGTKPALAQELVYLVLERFLDAVRSRIRASADPEAAIFVGVEIALQTAENDPLLRAVLGSAHAGDAELLPFITQSLDLIQRAHQAVFAEIAENFPTLNLGPEELSAAAEALVRLVISHIAQPSKPPSVVAAEIAWLLGALIERATAAGA